jgi:hypothetical protein
VPHGAEQHEEHRRVAFHPAAAHPHGSGERGDSEEQRKEAQTQLGRTERQEDDALHDEPAEWCPLTQPEASRQLPESAIANVDRDHLFINPQGCRPQPLHDIESNGGDGDKRGRIE